MTRSVALLLNQAGATEQTTTALALVERLLERGAIVRVFAHDEAAVLSAGNHPIAEAVRGLIRKGLHVGAFSWVVEGDAATALGVDATQQNGVVSGDHHDLWGMVRDADLVLSVGVGS